MQLIPVNKQTLPFMQSLYKEAFPRSERKPFSLLLEKQKEGLAELLLIQEEGETAPLGLMITLADPKSDIVLLDYFAVSPYGRGKGTGARALSLFRERFAGKRLLLEIERPDPSASNAEQRQRRKRFYLHNDFTETGIFVRVFGVEMELLTNGTPLSFPEYVRLYENTVGKLQTKLLRITDISATKMPT